ncbi:MAG: MFS transporter [Propionibacterium sp.]|nr:MFS transporter [Propionibacterium sp.]
MFVVVLAYLAFFSIALPPSMLGVAWPTLRLSFGVSLAAAGMIPPVGVAASLVSTTTAARVARRLGVGRLLAVGTLASGLALAGSALSVTWWQFLASVAVLGLAAGAIDATINAYAARTFGPRRINLLHACYGVGAVVSPLVVTVTLAVGGGWRTAYLIVSALLLVIGGLFTAGRRHWRPGPAPDARAAPGDGPRATAPWRAGAVLGLAAVLVQSGIESAVAIWGYTFLTQHLGVDAVVAGGLASGYWLTLVVGRLGFGWLAERIGAWPVLTTAVGLLGLAAVLVNLPFPTAGMAAVVLFGLACAPVYPLLILTTAERTSPEVADRVVGYQAAASALGAAVVPGLVGLAIQQHTGAFGPATSTLVVVATIVHHLMRRQRAASPKTTDNRPDGARVPAGPRDDA